MNGLKKRCDIQLKRDVSSPVIADDDNDKAWARIAEPVSLSELEAALEDM